MTQFRIDRKIYIKSFDKNIQRVTIRTQTYLKHPNDENIHDMRTSIRRLDASYRILPKKIRNKKKIKTFAKSYKDFFKLNSTIRDLDIIISKIPNNSNDTIVEKILNKLKQKRKNRLKKALIKATNLQKLDPPKLSKYKMSESKIQSIFDKTVSSLIDDIEENMTTVLTNMSAVSKLHEFRKDCKKLRYCLELIDDDTIPLLLKLKQIQNMLGDIHDNDITINYLKKLQNNNLELLIKNEIQLRKQNYEKFVSIMTGKK